MTTLGDAFGPPHSALGQVEEAESTQEWLNPFIQPKQNTEPISGTAPAILFQQNSPASLFRLPFPPHIGNYLGHSWPLTFDRCRRVHALFAPLSFRSKVWPHQTVAWRRLDNQAFVAALRQHWKSRASLARGSFQVHEGGVSPVISPRWIAWGPTVVVLGVEVAGGVKDDRACRSVRRRARNRLDMQKFHIRKAHAFTILDASARDRFVMKVCAFCGCHLCYRLRRHEHPLPAVLEVAKG